MLSVEEGDMESWGVRIVNATSGFVHRRAVRNAERALAEIRAQAAVSSLTRAYFEQRRELPQRTAR